MGPSVHGSSDSDWDYLQPRDSEDREICWRKQWKGALHAGGEGEYFQGAPELKWAHTCGGISSSTFDILYAIKRQNRWSALVCRCWWWCCTDKSGFRSRGFRSWLLAICTQQPCQSSRGKEVSADPAAEQGEVEMNHRCMCAHECVFGNVGVVEFSLEGSAAEVWTNFGGGWGGWGLVYLLTWWEIGEAINTSFIFWLRN